MHIKGKKLKTSKKKLDPYSFFKIDFNLIFNFDTDAYIHQSLLLITKILILKKKKKSL